MRTRLHAPAIAEDAGKRQRTLTAKPEMNVASRLEFSQFCSDAPSIQTGIAGPLMLGMHCIGPLPDLGGFDGPLQRIATPLLDGSKALCEVWHSGSPCIQECFEDIVLRRNDALLFGVIELDESRLTHSADQSPLLLAAESAYRQIFALLEAQDFPYLWRTWNYLPRIHATECGLERYRQFNIGRHQAFVAFERPVAGSPVACALGVPHGPLSIAFMAGRRPAHQIENPRQVSAFAYPAEYGPRSPTFTRAATINNGNNEVLFISGTASIVGHATLHHGDVIAQTRETVANLAILIEQANLRHPTAPYALQDLIYRVYVRHAHDYPLVRTTLEQLVGNAIEAAYLQADVCRTDLLVEIEALAFKPLPEQAA